MLAVGVALWGACVAAAPALSRAADWSRGEYAKLTVASDGSSYEFSYGATTFKSSASFHTQHLLARSPPPARRIAAPAAKAGSTFATRVLRFIRPVANAKVADCAVLAWPGQCL